MNKAVLSLIIVLVSAGSIVSGAVLTDYSSQFIFTTEICVHIQSEFWFFFLMGCFLMLLGFIIAICGAVWSELTERHLLK